MPKTKIVLTILTALLAVDCTQNPPQPIRTTLGYLCREDVSNATVVAGLNKNGWQYKGPLYNDGINCTVTLWVCYDPQAVCAK